MGLAGVCGRFSLGGVESEREVCFAAFRIQFVEVEGFWVLAVNERAEGHAVIPTARKVLDVHVLKGVTKFKKWKGSSKVQINGQHCIHNKHQSSYFFFKFCLMSQCGVS